MMIGDINQDSIIDILDVILIINFILDINSPNTEESLLADLNQDGIINVIDIVTIVNYIFSI